MLNFAKAGIDLCEAWLRKPIYTYIQAYIRVCVCMRASPWCVCVCVYRPFCIDLCMYHRCVYLFILSDNGRVKYKGIFFKSDKAIITI